MLLFQKAHLQEKDFPLKIDVLNYSPAAYQTPSEWTTFLSSIERRMRNTLDETSPDDLNGDMFDALIEAAARESYTSALRQKTEHLRTIQHNRKVLLGEMAEVRALRRDLDGALYDVLQQLAAYAVHMAAHSNDKEGSK